VIILRRLTIVLDEASEKGFGLTNNNASSLASYDIISLLPTTQTSFSLACLTHSMPGPLTAHIISLDLFSQPRLPFYLKHTLIRTAIRNGAVFEIPYAPALSPNDEHKRRNWWANAREVVRVTHGKGILLSGGGQTVADLRAPLDVANLATLLGIAQNLARDALSTTPKSLVLRAQTRKTYRAVLSEPKLILPSSTQASSSIPTDTSTAEPPAMASTSMAVPVDPAISQPHTGNDVTQPAPPMTILGKRPRGDESESVVSHPLQPSLTEDGGGTKLGGKQKKKKKHKGGETTT